MATDKQKKDAPLAIWVDGWPAALVRRDSGIIPWLRWQVHVSGVLVGWGDSPEGAIASARRRRASTSEQQERAWKA